MGASWVPEQAFVCTCRMVFCVRSPKGSSCSSIGYVSGVLFAVCTHKTRDVYYLLTAVQLGAALQLRPLPRFDLVDVDLGLHMGLGHGWPVAVALLQGVDCGGRWLGAGSKRS
jgi:hypothetical protein